MKHLKKLFVLLLVVMFATVAPTAMAYADDSETRAETLNIPKPPIHPTSLDDYSF